MSQELSGFCTPNGITVTSKHKCYKGKWYYATKKHLATIRENFAALQEKYNSLVNDKPTTDNLTFDRRKVLNEAIKLLKTKRDDEQFEDLTINDAIEYLRDFRDND